jgi:hypothetical protein
MPGFFNRVLKHQDFLEEELNRDSESAGLCLVLGLWVVSCVVLVCRHFAFGGHFTTTLTPLLKNFNISEKGVYGPIHKSPNI